MEPTSILQKLKREESSPFQRAEKYYNILSIVNNLALTEREVQLIAFAAIKGNISHTHLREEFCKKHNTTSPTINNIISKLKRMGILYKDTTKKIKVIPMLSLNFALPLTLEIKLLNAEA